MSEHVRNNYLLNIAVIFVQKDTSL